MCVTDSSDKKLISGLYKKAIKNHETISVKDCMEFIIAFWDERIVTNYYNSKQKSRVILKLLTKFPHVEFAAIVEEVVEDNFLVNSIMKDVFIEANVNHTGALKLDIFQDTLEKMYKRGAENLGGILTMDVEQSLDHEKEYFELPEVVDPDTNEITLLTAQQYMLSFWPLQHISQFWNQLQANNKTKIQLLMIGSPKEDPDVVRDGGKAEDGDAVQKFAYDSDEENFLKDEASLPNPDAGDYEYANRDQEIFKDNFIESIMQMNNFRVYQNNILIDHQVYKEEILEQLKCSSRDARKQKCE